MDVQSGTRVLEAATGTGHVALAAARRFCYTTGIDYVPALVEAARTRPIAEELDVALRVASAEDLPFDDDTCDHVLSAIGVMLTADHRRPAAELVAVCKLGGRVRVASRTPAGFIGQMLKTVGKYATPPPGAQPATRWGDCDDRV